MQNRLGSTNSTWLIQHILLFVLNSFTFCVILCHILFQQTPYGSLRGLCRIRTVTVKEQAVKASTRTTHLLKVMQPQRTTKKSNTTTSVTVSINVALSKSETDLYAIKRFKIMTIYFCVRHKYERNPSPRRRSKAFLSFVFPC